MESYKSLNQNGIIFLSLQKGNYKEITKEDNLGIRIFYLYTIEDIMDIAPHGLNILYEETQVLRDKEWITLVLRKSE